MLSRISLAALLLLLSLAPAHAQDALPVSEGERVRVRTPLGTFRGTVATADADSLVLRIRSRKWGDSITVPVSELQRLDVSAGPRPRVEGALRGAGVGLLASGVLTGMAAVAAATGENMDGWEWLGVAMVGVTVTPVLTVGGGVVGAVFPGEEWDRVRLRPRASVVAAGDGRVGAALTIRF